MAALLAVPVVVSIYLAALLRRVAPLRPAADKAARSPGTAQPAAQALGPRSVEQPARRSALPRPRLALGRPILALRQPILALRQPILALRQPILALRQPILALRQPILPAPTLLRPAMILAVGGLLTLGTYGPAPQPLRPAGPPVMAAAQPTAVARVGAAVVTGQGLVDALQFDFTSAMDGATVQAALAIEPAADLRFAWSGDGRTLQVRPAPAWRPATAYRVTIGSGARDVRGITLAGPVEASFVTRASVAAKLAMARAAGSRLAPTVLVTFTRPVVIASVGRAVKVSPAMPGTLSTTGGTSRGMGTRFAWRPRGTLQPGTSYTLSLAGGVIDEDGVRVAPAARLQLTAPRRPGIVRHRPATNATRVPATALLSVRFTERMDRRSTERAFAISGVVAASHGSFSWFEGDTVLAYDARAALVAGRRYTVTIAGSARSAHGVSLRAGSGPALTFSFQVAAPRTRPSTKRVPSGSGGSTGTGWPAVERYVLGLINCMRTGGTLQSDGDCVGYGSGKNGGYARPLTIHAGISDRVSRPYARFLATRAACNHFLDGNPGFRLRRAGYSSYRWAENIGCRSGNPYAAVLASHLYFQSEKSYRGGHWVNLKNPLYTIVGIGVWVSNGNVRVVTDFYDP